MEADTAGVNYWYNNGTLTKLFDVNPCGVDVFLASLSDSPKNRMDFDVIGINHFC
jgi:hypothetical protein